LNFYLIVKRILDITGALTGMLLLAPVMLVVAVAIHISMGSPVLFSQARPGINGRWFNIYKFRTMTKPAPELGTVVEDERRLTRLGNFLRRTSLDELPELWNVLKGDMSLVGPRPLLPDYIPLYTPEQARRHEVKPGITGWAQINGRNDISWDDKFKLDVWYVDNRSLMLDVRILVQTFIKVLKGEGVSKAGHVTTDRFRGPAP